MPFINGGGIGGSKTFFANLYNPALNGSGAPSVLGSMTNATLTINNDNNYGVFQFSAPTYVVNEATNGFATITVLRNSSSLSNALINFTTTNGTATAGVNYAATNGQLSFAPGQLAATFVVRVMNDGLTNVTPFYFNVLLTSASAGAVLGSPTNAQVNILDAQAFNRPPGSGDVTFGPTGINADVLALGLQTDGKIIAAGNFTGVNGIPRNHFARFNHDGSLDTVFLSGLSGANGSIFGLAVQTDGRIVIGGAFSSVNGVVRNRIARVGLPMVRWTRASVPVLARTPLFSHWLRHLLAGRGKCLCWWFVHVDSGTISCLASCG